jgi:hypothetical protein
MYVCKVHICLLQVDNKSEPLKKSAVKTASEVVTALMSTDEEYFLKFLKQAFEAQVLFEHLSYSYGLADGWS